MVEDIFMKARRGLKVWRRVGSTCAGILENGDGRISDPNGIWTVKTRLAQIECLRCVIGLWTHQRPHVHAIMALIPQNVNAL
jgi:hypothetical protein